MADNYQRALKAVEKATEQSDLESTDSEAIRGQERRVLRNQVKQRVEPSHENLECEDSPAIERPLGNTANKETTGGILFI